MTPEVGQFYLTLGLTFFGIPTSARPVYIYARSFLNKSDYQLANQPRDVSTIMSSHFLSSPTMFSTSSIMSLVAFDASPTATRHEQLLAETVAPPVTSADTVITAPLTKATETIPETVPVTNAAEKIPASGFVAETAESTREPTQFQSSLPVDAPPSTLNAAETSLTPALVTTAANPPPKSGTDAVGSSSAFTQSQPSLPADAFPSITQGSTATQIVSGHVPPLTTTTTTAVGFFPPGASSPAPLGHTHPNIGLIIGCTIGGVLVLLFTSVLLVYFIRKRRLDLDTMHDDDTAEIQQQWSHSSSFNRFSRLIHRAKVKVTPFQLPVMRRSSRGDLMQVRDNRFHHGARSSLLDDESRDQTLEPTLGHRTLSFADSFRTTFIGGVEWEMIQPQADDYTDARASSSFWGHGRPSSQSSLSSTGAQTISSPSIVITSISSDTSNSEETIRGSPLSVFTTTTVARGVHASVRTA